MASIAIRVVIRECGVMVARWLRESEEWFKSNVFDNETLV